MFSPEKYKNTKALVIGAGKSGVACANLLSSKGFAVLLTEAKPAAEVKERLKALSGAVTVETGGHSKAVFNCGFAVKSPGLSQKNPFIVSLKERGLPVFSEVEIALAYSGGAPLLAVTGTNGKTTTTLLLGDIMDLAATRKGGAGIVCGNVGIPAAQLAPGASPLDSLVMEVSSYQLEDSSYIKPLAAGLLNITPDHLDHHGGMAGYLRAKTRVFNFQGPEDTCVFNAADPLCMKLAARCKAKRLYFASAPAGRPLNAGLRKGLIYFKAAGKEFTAKPPDLPGIHNLENAMCAGLMALAAGARPSDIKKAFAEFKGVEHRIEPAGTVRGIKFINDSKATNVDSTLVALKAMPAGRRVWLILGGLGKGTPYAPLIPFIKEHVKAIVTIGEDAPRIGNELAGTCPVISAGTLRRACKAILKEGVKGDIALFSPACASFDQFKDFEDRGLKFKELVAGLS